MSRYATAARALDAEAAADEDALRALCTGDLRALYAAVRRREHHEARAASEFARIEATQEFARIAAAEFARTLTDPREAPVSRVADGPKPPRCERPRCGARCRDGHPCAAAVVWDPSTGAPRNKRCRMHGGSSSGPRSAEGRARVGAAASRSNATRTRASGRESPCSTTPR